MKPWFMVMLLLLPMPGRASPSWAKEGAHRFVGNAYEVVCSGLGPSIFHARMQAIDSCRLTAANTIQQSLKVKQLTVETEADAAYHGEITQEQYYGGLICKPLNEAVEEEEDHTRVWLKCSFDLTKIKTVNMEAKRQKPIIALSDKRRITIASVPACESILIRGKKPRVIRCKSNPFTILLEPGDERLIIRAKGHLPREFSASDIKESQDIIMERAR